MSGHPASAVVKCQACGKTTDMQYAQTNYPMADGHPDATQPFTGYTYQCGECGALNMVAA